MADEKEPVATEAITEEKVETVADAPAAEAQEAPVVDAKYDQLLQAFEYVLSRVNIDIVQATEYRKLAGL